MEEFFTTTSQGVPCLIEGGGGSKEGKRFSSLKSYIKAAGKRLAACRNGL